MQYNKILLISRRIVCIPSSKDSIFTHTRANDDCVNPPGMIQEFHLCD